MLDKRITNQPLLSIVTIAFNNLQGLSLTFNSLVEQIEVDFGLIEFIVIDSASTDGTKDFLKLISRSDLTTYIVSESDDGIYHAMNKGVNIANGKYINFLNSGDTLFSQYSLCHALKDLSMYETELDIMIAGHQKNYGYSLDSFKRVCASKPISHIQYGMPTSHQSIFYSAGIIKKHPFICTFKYASDYAHLCQLYGCGKLRLNYISKTIYASYDMHGATNQLTNYPNVLREVIIAKRKYLHQSWLSIIRFVVINTPISIVSMSIAFLIGILHDNKLQLHKY